MPQVRASMLQADTANLLLHCGSKLFWGSSSLSSHVQLQGNHCNIFQKGVFLVFVWFPGNLKQNWKLTGQSVSSSCFKLPWTNPCLKVSVSLSASLLSFCKVLLSRKKECTAKYKLDLCSPPAPTHLESTA